MPNHPHQSPLHDAHAKLEAFFLPYGSAESYSDVVETFGDLDMEYAALRKGCVIFDQNHIGTIVVSGDERGSFLNNMLTAKVDDLKAGESQSAFWLNRKGRIDADIRIAQRDERMVFALDRHLCKLTSEALNSFVFAEDVEIIDSSDRYHRLGLHGPTAWKLIEKAAKDVGDLIDVSNNTQVLIDGVDVLIERVELTGEIGLELCIGVDELTKVYDCLIRAADEYPELKARTTGWLAINAARIEAGHPMYHVDFDDTNVPAESGIIEDRVNLAKGCYLGQEVVARMHARNACSKRVVAIRVEDQQITTEQPEICQPAGGAQIFELGKEGETPIGSVTSSTISPMLGAVPICFAMLKNSVTKPGTQLSVIAEGKIVTCTVQETLVFWAKPDAHA